MRRNQKLRRMSKLRRNAKLRRIYKMRRNAKLRRMYKMRRIFEMRRNAKLRRMSKLKHFAASPEPRAATPCRFTRVREGLCGAHLSTAVQPLAKPTATVARAPALAA